MKHKQSKKKVKRICLFLNKSFYLESETLKLLEKVEAETKSEVSKIQNEQELFIKEISQKIEEIESILF